MGITADFLIKHVRPGDDTAFAMVCGDDQPLRRYLESDLGMSAEDVTTVFTSWAAAIDSGLDQALAIEMAESVSLARWSELYPTARSTVLFLGGALVQQLSVDGADHPSETFDFLPPEHFRYAITIHQNGTAPEVVTDAEGAQLASDAQGNVVHFGGLIGGD